MLVSSTVQVGTQFMLVITVLTTVTVIVSNTDSGEGAGLEGGLDQVCLGHFKLSSRWDRCLGPECRKLLAS